MDLSTGKEYLHSCMVIIFMCVKIMFLLFCHSTPEQSFGRMAVTIIVSGVTGRYQVINDLMKLGTKCKQNYFKSRVDK